MPVSVVIPAFNAAPFLPQTLRSVAAQTRAPHEVLVVDDGSTDGTVDVARALGARVLETGGNRGPSTARNLGIEAATGSRVAFVDADDIWEPTHLETVAGALDAAPAAVLAFARIRKFVDVHGGDEDGPLFWISPAIGEDGVPMDALQPLLEENNPVPQSTVVARREALRAVGGYDAALRHSEDFDLWCRVARRGPFVQRHAITCRYRVHARQASSTGALAITRASWVVRRRVLDALQDDGPREMVDRLRGRLRAAYADELRVAWRSGDLPGFDTLLELQELAPDGRHTAERWRMGRLALPVWASVRSAARRMRRSPAGVTSKES